jgi:hypothetical protein
LGTRYAGDAEALRDAVFPDVDLLRHWWLATGYPELKNGWTLALSRSSRHEDRATLAALVAEARAGEKSQLDVEQQLAELGLAAWGTLKLGATERQLLDDDTLGHWSVPPVGDVVEAPPESATKSDSGAPLLVRAEQQELALGTERNLAEALQSLQDAAEAGDGEAAFRYALRLEHGVGAQADPAAALRWYTVAAEHGHARAAYRLGQMYEEGAGVPSDAATAGRWYARAAAAGHPAAHYALARVLLGDDKLRAESMPTARAALYRLIDVYPRSKPESDLAWLAGEAWLLARANGFVADGATLPDRLPARAEKP